MSKFYTNVGKINVCVKNYQYLSIVTFKAGKDGPAEAGDFAFWTAVFKKAVKLPLRRTKASKLTGRARLILPVGDRFDRMKFECRKAKDKEDRKIYKAYWDDGLKHGKNIAYIRPSTYKEINNWIKTHEPDAKHIIRIKIGK